MSKDGSVASTRQDDVRVAREFLLPSVAEIKGIMSPDWVRPKSLDAKDAILRLLGWDKEMPLAE